VLKDWFNTNKRFRGNRLTSHLRAFATSVMDDGYADVTVKSKLWVLANFGQWLGRRGLSVTNIDERLVEGFIKPPMYPRAPARGHGFGYQGFPVATSPTRWAGLSGLECSPGSVGRQTGRRFRSAQQRFSGDAVATRRIVEPTKGIGGTLRPFDCASRVAGLQQSFGSDAP
jgi:hypothetical protein